MDFRHIRAFIAVAESLSVTRAAERLHISQPPLSRHIHQLEHELGLTLFVRHRHGVTLTDAGRWLLDKARSLDAAASDFYETAGQLAGGETGRIRIGIGWGLWDAVNRVRVEFARRHPEVVIEARDGHCGDDSTEQLRNHTLDVSFGRPPFDASIVTVVPLFEERIQVAICSDHALRPSLRTGVSVRDLAGETLLQWDRHVSPVLYDRISAVYAAAGITPATLPTPGAGPFNPAGLMLVASGRGVYLCLGVAHRGSEGMGGVTVLPVTDPGATIEVCLTTRRGDTSPVVAHFLDCVRRVFPAAGEPAPVRVNARAAGF
jgi:DNA-binding transcriptional LysR family regulator